MVPHIIFANILYWFVFPPYGENLREKNDYTIITSDFTTVILSGCDGKSDSVIFHLLLEQTTSMASASLGCLYTTHYVPLWDKFLMVEL